MSAAIRSLTSAIAACIASPARTARSGSSSWETGAPNTPMTLSPMYLSIVPPCRSTSSPSRRRARSMSVFIRSGSRRSETAVYPERSAKSTVALRRSSGGGSSARGRAGRASSAASGLPHSMQNFA